MWDDINRQVLHTMLQRDGHRVSEARNGAEGVAAAARERFDLVLMDIRMPVMNGEMAARAIRAGEGASRHSAIYALTANALTASALGEQGVGLFDGVLTKPLAREALREVLRATESVGERARLVDTDQNGFLRESAGVGYNALLARFATEMDGLLRAPPADLAALAAQSHRVAASAAVFGATNARATLNTLEDAARRGDPSEAAHQLIVLRDAWSATFPLLRPSSEIVA